MTTARIIVTGATGKTGIVVVTELFNNWLRTVAQFLITPLSHGFNLDRYDRELRRPFPSEPQVARESKVWQRGHTIADAAKTTMPELGNARPATGHTQSLEFE